MTIPLNFIKFCDEPVPISLSHECQEDCSMQYLLTVISGALQTIPHGDLTDSCKRKFSLCEVWSFWLIIQFIFHSLPENILHLPFPDLLHLYFTKCKNSTRKNSTPTKALWEQSLGVSSCMKQRLKGLSVAFQPGLLEIHFKLYRSTDLKNA